MAKQIIILERLDEPSDNSYRYVLWATVPAARVSAYADPAATSAYKDATAPELAAIQAGQIVERASSFSAPAGTTIPQIQTRLIAEWTNFQAQINARNPTVRYGSFWDGTAWTAAGTA